MTPKQRYQQDLTQTTFKRDVAQGHAVEALQVLFDRLLLSQKESRSFFNRLFSGTDTVPGIYLVGSVGRGKTYLMDVFYECLQQIDKQRVHYHRFMTDIHEQLRTLPKSPDPLLIVGKKIAQQTRVLCLDEFHVTDVADAMLLAGLLKVMFKNGVTMVVTSNTRIDDLYLNGLQRERFMDAIALLKDYMVEIDLKNGTDYRLEHLEKVHTYHIDSNLDNHECLQSRFKELAPAHIEYNKSLTIYNREIQTLAVADDVVWFDFSELCDTPRAAKDYLELAKRYHTLFLSRIPVMKPANDSAAKRFMHLIDALYDHRVKLIATAQTTPQEIYQGNLLSGIFDRTVSRLIEMSSHDYLAEPHRI